MRNRGLLQVVVQFFVQSEANGAIRGQQKPFLVVFHTEQAHNRMNQIVDALIELAWAFTDAVQILRKLLFRQLNCEYLFCVVTVEDQQL